MSASQLDRKDFAAWALSEINSNLKRGLLAEYLVACALKVESKKHEDWNGHDLDYRGQRIEVKSSGFSSPPFISTLKKPHPSFDIKRRLYCWNGETLKMEKYDTPQRFNDIFVFAYTLATTESEYRPFSLTCWEFIVAPTKKIDALFGNQKSVALNQLKRFFQPLSFDFLKIEIDRLEGSTV